MNKLHSSLTNYLRLTGWKEPSTLGPRGGLWVIPDTDWMILVPNKIDENAPDWPFILERLAKFNNTTVTEVQRQIALTSVDILNLRASNDAVIGDTIPFRTGLALAQSGWTMLRSCATTAMGPKANIRGKYRRSADNLISSARMAQTKIGSYIIPIYVPISKVEQINNQDTLIDQQVAQSDPPERRVTRTFAQALDTIKETVVIPHKTPNTDAIHHLITSGVSREFATALHKILNDKTIESFTTDFDWAADLNSPASSLQTTISIPSDASGAVEHVARKLTQITEVSHRERLTGTVIGVYRSQPSGGRITVSTYRNGRSANVHINVTDSILDSSLDWMRQKSTVVTDGSIRRVGDGLQIDKLDGISLLQNTLLHNN